LHQLTRSTDNVHCTPEDYENLASVIHYTGTVWDIESASAAFAGARGGRKGAFFWRGLINQAGSARPLFSAGNNNTAKRRAGRTLIAIAT
jgi:hypothetical protein